MATPNGTQFQVATDAAFTSKLIDYAGAYKTSHPTVAGVLTKGVPLYARVRHSSVETGYSAWGATRQFSISSYRQKILYQATVDGTRRYGSGILIDSDGYVYLLGTHTITKLSNDYSGTVLWSKRPTDTTEFVGFFNCGTFDNSGHLYVLKAVYSSQYGGVNHLLKLRKTDGSIVWEKTSGVLYPYAPIMRFRDNHIWFCTKRAFSHNRLNAIMKITTDGVIVHTHTFTQVGDYDGGGFYFDAAGNMYLGGGIKYSTSSDYSVGWVLKLDPNFNNVWCKRFSSPLGVSYHVSLNFDETTGLMYWTGRSPNGDLTVIKLDQNGNVLWQKLIPADANNNWMGRYGTLLYNGELYLKGDSHCCMKLKADGTVDWAFKLTSTTGATAAEDWVYNVIGGIALDPNTNTIYVQWTFSGYQTFLVAISPNIDNIVTGTLANLSTIAFSRVTLTSSPSVLFTVDDEPSITYTYVLETNVTLDNNGWRPIVWLDNAATFNAIDY